MDSGFIGGVALQNYRRDMQAQSSVPRDNGDKSATLARQESHQQTVLSERPVPSPINTSVPPRPRPQALQQSYKAASSSFVTPTDLQHPPYSAPPKVPPKAPPKGRRPAGTRLTSDPAALGSTSHQPEPQKEPPKAKKGLPFLKNPMSTLLMRRKHVGQNPPDVPPLPLATKTEEEEPAYDPRIRGTRVHDFSAPRRKPIHSDPRSGSSGSIPTTEKRQPSVPASSHDDPRLASPEQRRTALSDQSSADTAASFSPAAPPGPSSNDLEDRSGVPAPTFSQRRRPVPGRDPSVLSGRSQKSASSHLSDASTAAPLPEPAGAIPEPHSRNISISSEVSLKSRLSGVPKHMKSTSSRFSFDMIGAAKQEKIMEERHRQREAEKKVTEEAHPRDSRFDDFDEDSFDYDAMMDDDGLEEKIPGVNADYDEDDFYIEEDLVEDNTDDPDNDQENFAGFAFQRSEGTSPLIGSHEDSGTTGTPREADGNLAAPPNQESLGLQESPIPPSQPESLRVPDGLGIHSMPNKPLPISESNGEQPQSSSAPRNNRAVSGEEDLYFDDGLAGLEDEFAEDLARPPSFDETPFDESIFDNNDTDQYGRPIAGAFAQAQSQRQAAVKRESDMTSRFSGQSEVMHSTAHTSLSTGMPQQNHNEQPEQGLQEEPNEELESAPNSYAPEKNSMAAYQAALAAAAHQAAASGKFLWKESSSDNTTPAQEDHSPVDKTTWKPDDYEAEDDGDFGYENLDDFELDDDAIIAEANASALANDSDGWYGHEFGFYSSAPGHHANHNSESSQSDDFMFANGGFFGPKGMDGVSRTKSGRVVSREPNLTPITERSEYSNRNSIMSMGMPGPAFGTPIQSPGLAQLAMMSDRGDEMTLSSLLRLRSKAWGDSQASQASSREGSPRSERGETPFSAWSDHLTAQQSSARTLPVRKASYKSARSFDSDLGSAADSPTVTMAMPVPAGLIQEPTGMSLGVAARRPSVSSQPERIRTTSLTGGDASFGAPVSAGPAISPADSKRSQDGISPHPSERRPARGHQKRNSADSISYTLEEGSGETRWVIERRRIAESGQVETEREVVEGGRI